MTAAGRETALQHPPSRRRDFGHSGLHSAHQRLPFHLNQACATTGGAANRGGRCVDFAGQTVAGAAREHPIVLVFALLLPITLMGVAANWVARLLQKHRWIAYIGLANYFLCGLRDDLSRRSRAETHHQHGVDAPRVMATEKDALSRGTISQLRIPDMMNTSDNLFRNSTCSANYQPSPMRGPHTQRFGC